MIIIKFNIHKLKKQILNFKKIRGIFKHIQWFFCVDH